MSQFEQYRSPYETEGFVVIRQFYNDEEITQLKRELDRFIKDVIPTAEPGQAFFHDTEDPTTLKQINYLDNDPWFASIPLMERWTDLAKDLLGEDVTSKAPQWFNKPPATNHPTPPHQDNYYFNLVPPKVCTMWLALDDVDKENGCLRYLPGSHLEPIRPHLRTSVLGFSQGIEEYTDKDFAREVAIEMQPGDLAIHHGDTIHRADANQSTSRHRRSFAVVFQGISCERDAARFARYQERVKQQHNELGYK
ncbi:Phytanoyl-CoA dioxygenase (PhyH) [Polystyrenella longa]|uniref:Phytanoyl-CoA dioxygenase (PhyH) n=2 Tax=Polystyrenella longa TaxID=2528007 RepID=A0A518CQU2_9PLAN|nr:Phytanoyl-CoA dioxygenase (PhyH) [Polystyrenella longa]